MVSSPRCSGTNAVRSVSPHRLRSSRRPRDLPWTRHSLTRCSLHFKIRDRQGRVVSEPDGRPAVRRGHQDPPTSTQVVRRMGHDKTVSPSSPPRPTGPLLSDLALSFRFIGSEGTLGIITEGASVAVHVFRAGSFADHRCRISSLSYDPSHAPATHKMVERPPT